MAADLTAQINIIAVDAASNILRNVGSAFSGLLNNLPGPAKVAVGAIALAGAAVVGVAVKATQMAADFQSSMLKVQAYAGMSGQATQDMARQILALAPTLGVAPKALADGLYFVASAGFKGADALTVLKYAGMTAASANVDAQQTSFALVASLNALNLKGNQAGNIMDELNATVKNGLLTWSSYGSVVGKLAGAVNVAGGGATMTQHNFTALNAALDVYTNGGISAHQASMWLNADMSLLYGKAGSLATNAKKAGVSFDSAKYATLDFAQKLQYLNTITDGNHDKLVKLLGGNSQVANSVQFLNNNYKTWGSTITNIDSLMQHGKTTQSMFAVAQQGLNFQVQRAKAAFDSLMIQIGQALLPVVTRFMSQITPLLAQFAAWLTKSGALQVAANVLGGVLTGLINTILWLVNTGAAIVGFFQKNQWAMDLLIAVLVGAGVAILVFAATFIPALVAGFIAWAVAAGAAAMATLAAAAPFILIGLIIAAVVFGIIMAVQHWGQIVGWLKGVWGAISGWFGNLFSGIGTALHNLVTSIGTMFSNLGSTVHGKLADIKNGVGGFFSNVGSTAHNAWQGLQQGAQNGAQGVVNAFSWMYNHNYYFKDLVDFVKTTWTNGIKFWQGVWTNFVTWLGNLWHGIQTTASNAWSAIANFFETTWNNDVAFLQKVWTLITSALQLAWSHISSWLQGTWKTISNFFETIWNNDVAFLGKIWNLIISAVQLVWSKISSIFSSAWNTYIAGPLGSLWNSIWTTITGWGNQALNAGKNLITMLANGIASGAGAIWNAVTGIAKNIWSALGFHSPAEAGPGADADKWMPNLISMLSSGLVAGVPKMQTAVNQVAVTLTPLAVQNSAPVAAPGSPQRSGQASGGVSIGDIHVHLGDSSGSAQSQGRAIANVVKQELANVLRQQSIAPRFTAGGR